MTALAESRKLPTLWQLLAIVAVVAMGLVAGRASLYEAVEDERLMRQRHLAILGVIGGAVSDDDDKPIWLSDPRHFAQLDEAVCLSMVVYSCSLVVLRLVCPRGTAVQAVRLPGTSASVACVSVMSLHLLGRGAWLAANLFRDLSVRNVRWRDLLVVQGDGIGGSVLAVWVVLYFARLTRVDWDWIEVLGVSVGIFWILETFAQAAVIAIIGR